MTSLVASRQLTVGVSVIVYQIGFLRSVLYFSGVDWVFAIAQPNLRAKKSFIKFSHKSASSFCTKEEYPLPKM